MSFTMLSRIPYFNNIIVYVTLTRPSVPVCDTQRGFELIPVDACTVCSN